MLRDLRFAVRMLIRNPTVTLAAVVSLAIGIGANSTVFSLVDALLFRPMTVKDAARFVRISGLSRTGTPVGLSYPDYRDLAAQTTACSGLSAADNRGFPIKDNGRMEVVLGQFVSPNYFKVLGIEPALGRAFLPDEEGSRGGQTVAVIGYGLWQRRYGGDPNVLGRTIVVRERPTVIVGIAPRNFQGTELVGGSEIWVPSQENSRGYRGWDLFGRMKPGVSVAQVQAEMDVLVRHLTDANPATNKEGGAIVTAELDNLKQRLKGFVPLLLVGLVLLISCATVQNLMLARAEARQRELAVRSALGASRRRLIRQMLTESMLLSLLGAGLGLLLARWAIDFLPTLLPRYGISLPVQFGIDLRVLLFTACASCFSALVFGLIPALRASRLNLVDALKTTQSPPLPGFRWFSLRDALVAGQAAVCTALLVASLLLVRSLMNLNRVELGFAKRPMLILEVIPPSSLPRAQQPVFYNELLERAAALPGVSHVALTTRVPLSESGTGATQRVYADGLELPPGDDALAVRFSAVSSGYFEAMGTRLLLGRGFLPSDTANSAKVALVNQSLARRLWPGQDPVGKYIRIGGPAGVPHEVVGLVQDGKYIAVTDAPEPYLYLSMSQFWWGEATLVLQTHAAPDTLRAPAAELSRRMNPDAPLLDAVTLEEHVRASLWMENALAKAVSGFGLLALLLTCVGVYSVVSYSVSRRTREIGVRMALGATRRAVLALVIRQGLVLSLIGTAIGLVVTLAVVRSLAAFLYGVSVFDPVTFGLSAVLLIAVTLAATFLPARSALRVEPAAALRYE